MGQPHKPAFVKQLDGSRFGGTNCNMAATAMAIDRATLGKTRVSGARVRELTGDTSGGTNLGQARFAALKLGVDLDVKYGYPLSSFDLRIRSGQGAVLQGQSSATRGTKYQASETFGGNHSWYVNAARGWDANGRPIDYYVLDPLADGRRKGIAQSPFWIPRAYLLLFAERLDIGGGRRLGPGRVYAGFTRDTEPHAHLKHGARHTRPLPDRTKGKAPRGRRVNVRAAPTTKSAIVETLARGELFIAFQKTRTGQSLAGSRVWFGDHAGKRWVHRSGLSGKGGTT